MSKMTIKEIADKANVSVSTVSRVLNHPELVSEDIRFKIRQIMKDEGYTPNSFARSLKSKKSNIVGVLVPSLEVQFFADIVHILGNILNNQNIMMFVAIHNDIAEQEKNCIDAMLQMQADIIINATTNANDDYLMQINDAGTPVILLDRTSKLDGFITVATDKEYGYYQLMKHLYSGGCRSFHLITGGTDILTNFERFQGSTRFLFENGLQLNTLQCHYGDFTVEYGYSCCESLFNKQTKEPIAILAGSANIAAGVYRYCLDNKIDIPNQASVVALGNFKNDFLIQPTLTHLDDMRNELGSKIAEILLQMIKPDDNKPIDNHQSYTFKPNIIIGKSTLADL